MSTEKEQVEQDDVTELQSQAGDLLREARVNAGMSQQDIADKLRLKLTVIQSIDENNFEFDQVATFTRGYLRSYARLVSLDEKLVLNALGGVDGVQHKEHSMQSFSRKTNKEKHDRRIMKITWGILAIIIGIWAAWWYQNQKDTATETSEPDTVKALSVTPRSDSKPADTQFETISGSASESAVSVDDAPEMVAETNEKSVEPEMASQQNIAVQQDVTTALEPTLTEEQPIAAVEPVIASTEADKKDNTLTMSFSADCWVQVKDATGKALATGVKKKGGELTVSGEPPYKIILGAPEGVTMTFASEPVDLSGYTSGKVARFTLP